MKRQEERTGTRGVDEARKRRRVEWEIGGFSQLAHMGECGAASRRSEGGVVVVSGQSLVTWSGRGRLGGGMGTEWEEGAAQKN